jgi:hypothetical protein
MCENVPAEEGKITEAEMNGRMVEGRHMKSRGEGTKAKG